MNSIDIFLIILNPILLGVIAYLSIRKLKNLVPETIENLKKDVKRDLEEWLNSETGQKALYSLGALIGNGAIAGAGIGKKRGKFRWEDLIGEIASAWIQGKIQPKAAGSEPARASEGLKSA